ncbi:hypothetical protein HDU97_001248 [Phlyctochytrium planicorne]|nr:hypothetical protein HDU97_001248 [Phlyctochytrium planicorne]
MVGNLNPISTEPPHRHIMRNSMKGSSINVFEDVEHALLGQSTRPFDAMALSNMVDQMPLTEVSIMESQMPPSTMEAQSSLPEESVLGFNELELEKMETMAAATLELLNKIRPKSSTATTFAEASAASAAQPKKVSKKRKKSLPDDSNTRRRPIAPLPALETDGLNAGIPGMNVENVDVSNDQSGVDKLTTPGKKKSGKDLSESPGVPKTSSKKRKKSLPTDADTRRSPVASLPGVETEDFNARNSDINSGNVDVSMEGPNADAQKTPGKSKADKEEDPLLEYIGIGPRIKNVEGEFEELDMRIFAEPGEDVPLVSWNKDPSAPSPNDERYSECSAKEIEICTILRMEPKKYLEIKETILALVAIRGPLRKSSFKTWFKVTHYKVIRLFEWFDNCGWSRMAMEEWARRRALKGEIVTSRIPWKQHKKPRVDNQLPPTPETKRQSKLSLKKSTQAHVSSEEEKSPNMSENVQTMSLPSPSADLLNDGLLPSPRLLEARPTPVDEQMHETLQEECFVEIHAEEHVVANDVALEEKNAVELPDEEHTAFDIAEEEQALSGLLAKVHEIAEKEHMTLDVSPDEQALCELLYKGQEPAEMENIAVRIPGDKKTSTKVQSLVEFDGEEHAPTELSTEGPKPAEEHVPAEKLMEELVPTEFLMEEQVPVELLLEEEVPAELLIAVQVPVEVPMEEQVLVEPEELLVVEEAPVEPIVADREVFNLPNHKEVPVDPPIKERIAVEQAAIEALFESIPETPIGENKKDSVTVEPPPSLGEDKGEHMAIEPSICEDMDKHVSVEPPAGQDLDEQTGIEPPLGENKDDEMAIGPLFGEDMDEGMNFEHPGGEDEMAVDIRIDEQVPIEHPSDETKAVERSCETFLPNLTLQIEQAFVENPHREVSCLPSYCEEMSIEGQVEVAPLEGTDASAIVSHKDTDGDMHRQFVARAVASLEACLFNRGFEHIPIPTLTLLDVSRRKARSQRNFF